MPDFDSYEMVAPFVWLLIYAVGGLCILLLAYRERCPQPKKWDGFRGLEAPTQRAPKMDHLLGARNACRCN